MNITELMGLFSNPETIKTLNMGDKMMGVGVTVILGMGITVTALIFIQFLIGMMTTLLAEKPKPVVAAETSQVAPMKPDVNDPELMAAISAAVAAKMGISQKSIVKTVVEKR
ncbi:OadG family transporter subunit [uncultured Ilyobacter sp.]|uniref:OadG family transporter subunit n=1 Tax=uncultured Ilyobacter sp. TaxID=544433 RepID=UPI0029C666D1|nr:OadG family transporter subunit [uncultured Ilyobacter sp.]